jgi:dihydroneopterin aldolase
MEHIRQCVALTDLRFYSYHGYYPEEQVLGNEFAVTIRVYFHRSTTAADDALGSTVNYEVLYDVARREMQHPRKLLETVAESILRRIYESFPFIDEAEVTLVKYQPPFGGDRGSASVTLSWQKST